jgi:hypothetical protein
VLEGGGINLSFRRNFGHGEIQEWDQLERERVGTCSFI